MRIYNPQNQFGEDLITKILVKDITGLEAASTKGSLDSRLTNLENASPASAVQSVEGDCSDALVKVGLTKDGTKAKATVTVVKAELTEGVISGAGVATGTQVAEAIATEKTRAEGVEKNITDAIGTWGANTKFEATTTVKAAIDSVKASIDSLTDISGFEVVSALPEGDAIHSNTIYLKAVTGGEGQDIYEEYVPVKGANGTFTWEKLGTATADLKNYYTKSEVDTTIGTLPEGKTVAAAIADAQGAANNALEKIGDSTKGLTKALAEEASCRQAADNAILTTIGTEGVDGAEGSGILGRIQAIEESIGDGGSIGETVAAHTAILEGFGTGEGETATVAGAIATAKSDVIGTTSDTAAADTVKGAKAAVADEATARKTADAALVASVTGDLTTGTASDAVKVIASTAAGNATAGTGKAVTLHAQVTTATVNSSTKALSGTGLATGTQVQDAIDEAVKSITTGKVAVGQVLTSTTLSLATGKLTVTPATGVATFKILEVRYNGEEWAGKLDGANAIILWDADAPADKVPADTTGFEVDYIVKSLTA